MMNSLIDIIALIVFVSVLVALVFSIINLHKANNKILSYVKIHNFDERLNSAEVRLLNAKANVTRELFDNEEVTVINARDLDNIPLGVWQYINNNEIRYRIVDKAKNHYVSITEWLEDSTFKIHLHEDADEEDFVIKGQLVSELDGEVANTFESLKYKKGVIHKVRAKKGTLISVHFKL